MAFTKKQAVTSVSVLYLIGVSALAGYATSRSDRMKLPIPPTLSSFTTFLPIISGLLLELGYDITRHREKRSRSRRGSTPRPPLVIIANTLIFIYSSVVITLLGTHAGPPAGLNCGLESQWTRLFRQKNAEAIRTIQDAFHCCGLMNAHDRAWPFPDKEHKADACQKQLGYDRGCLGVWRREEQRVAGLMMAVVGFVTLWQMTIILCSIAPRTAWIHRVLPDRISRIIGDEEGGDSGQRRVIGYHAVDNRYTDGIITEEEEEEGAEQDVAPRRAIGEGPQNVKNNILTSGSSEHEIDPRLRTEDVWNS